MNRCECGDSECRSCGTAQGTIAATDDGQRDFAMCGLQSEIAILRERLRKMTEAMWAWERTARYERAARSRLERAVEFHKLATPMSVPMADDLTAAIRLADERWADAHYKTPKENA